MSRSLTIQINSHDRVSGTETDFVVGLGKDHRVSNVRGCAIKSVQFVNSFYNINSHNNTWYYDVGGPELSIEIPVGQYNVSQLIAAIEAEFFLAGLVVNIVEDTMTHKFEIVMSANPIRIYKTRPNGELNPIHRVVGFRDDLSSTPLLSYSCPALHDLTGVRTVNVTSETLAGGHGITSRNNGNKLALLDTIPISVAFGQAQSHDPSDLPLDSIDYDQVLSNNMSSIDITLRDQDNNVLDSNGLNFVLTLKLYF